MEKNRTVYAKASAGKATAELVIKDFVEVMKTSQPGKSYSSDTFMVGEIPMAIEIYPNGSEEEDRGEVSVFLSNQSDADLDMVKCQFVTEIKTMIYDDEMAADSHRGILYFLSHADCTAAYKDKDS